MTNVWINQMYIMYVYYICLPILLMHVYLCHYFIKLVVILILGLYINILLLVYVHEA